jgi:hypothetical protein
MIALMEAMVSHQDSSTINSDGSTHLPMVGDVWFDCGDETA